MEHTYLARIIATHRQVANNDQRSLADLRSRADQVSKPRDFIAALRTVGASKAIACQERPGRIPSVIAEIKRKSPSKGVLRADLDPAVLACDYARGGAAALSVLTDSEFFGGSPDDLMAAQAATGLVTLRKDFTVSEHDVFDARIMGADAVLLIVAALAQDELQRFSDLASELGMAALVEVHDLPELERALAVNATLVGVNQRDLTTFEVDEERAQRLSAEMPDEVVRVAESGIRHATDVQALGEVGYDAVLVGERLVTSEDPAAELAGLLAQANSPIPKAG